LHSLCGKVKNTKRPVMVSRARNMKKGIQKFLTCSCVVMKKKSTKNTTKRKASTSQNTMVYKDLNSAKISMMKKNDATIINIISSRVRSPN